MTENRHTPVSVHYAVWYFVAATFIFAVPVIVMPEAPFWMRILTLIIGFVLVVLGGIRLAHEIRERRSSRPPQG